jgi:hypothetical protein
MTDLLQELFDSMTWIFPLLATTMEKLDLVSYKVGRLLHSKSVMRLLHFSPIQLRHPHQVDMHHRLSFHMNPKHRHPIDYPLFLNQRQRYSFLRIMQTLWLYYLRHSLSYREKGHNLAFLLLNNLMVTPKKCNGLQLHHPHLKWRREIRT